MKLLLHIAAVMILGIAVVSCSSTPSFVIPPDEMAEVMADIHTGEAIVESGTGAFHTDSARQALKQSILARHNVTLEKFDTSLYWYGQHVDKFMEVNDKTIEILTKRIEEAQKLGNVARTVTKFSEEGDSVNIWTGPTMVNFTEKSPSEILPFFYSGDRNWERGDIYTISLKPIDNESPVAATITAEYNDGTAEYVSGSLNGEGVSTLSLYLDSAKIAVNIFGQISYSPRPGENAYVDSIAIIRTRAANNSLHEAAAASQNLIRYRQ